MSRCTAVHGPSAVELPREKLEPAHVHLWEIDLDELDGIHQGSNGMLPADELARASRFHFERDRKRFISGRAALRIILSRYAGEPPERLSFGYGRWGKPRLQDGASVRFNLSHSGGRALLAVAHGRRLGIDVERIRPDLNLEVIARHFFSARENQALLELPPEERADAFFACWTRKEAFIKALGTGLSHPLASFDVSLSAHEPAALLRTEQGDADNWSMHDVSPANTFRAAVVVEGPVRAISRRRFRAAEMRDDCFQ